MSAVTARDVIELPDAPAVPGLRFRRMLVPHDYAGMAEANQATRIAAGRPSAISTADMAQFLGHLVGFDPGQDALIVERDGVTIGYALAMWRDLVDGRRAFVSYGILRPEQRGQGIGGAMLRWVDDRLATIAAGLRHPRPSYRNAFTWGDDVQGASLLRKNGWTEQARGFEMLRPTLDDIPRPALPDGLEVRPVTAADSDRVWNALAEAFRDHRGQVEAAEEDRERFLGDERQDPSLWLIAFDGTEIAGGVIGMIDDEENREHDRLRGIVDGVFTRRPWRRRGLARALVAASLAQLRDRGMTSASLSVDGANPNQALTLYEDLGFEIASVELDWIKSPTEPPPTNP
jgi:ribosomal protein S18 acetylase RimI-like enzyme